MNKIALEIIGLSYSHSQSGAYALILGEKNSRRRLPIIIGTPEAQSIAIAMEKLENKRPLTHDLLKTLMGDYGISLKEVVINHFMEGVFFSELITEKDGEIASIDARTSDAIALAIRFKCPVYAYPQVLEDAGIIFDEIDLDDDDDDEMDDIDTSDNEFFSLSLSDLNDMLQEAIDNEHYELASKIRDEIKKRQF